MRILLVEEDRKIGGTLVNELTEGGYSVDWVRSARDAAAALRVGNATYQIVVLDGALPDRSAAVLLRSLRQAGNNAAVIIMTSANDLYERMGNLDFEADDFIVKPFDFEELAARIRAVMRRRSGRAEPVLSTSTLRLDPNSRCVVRDETTIRLTAREYALLHSLMMRPGSIFSRSQLEDCVYSKSEGVQSNAVEFLIHQLRQKIGPEQIENRRGLGWRLCP
jgi:two-component system OmpR family response regulator